MVEAPLLIRATYETSSANPRKSLFRLLHTYERLELLRKEAKKLLQNPNSERGLKQDGK